MVYYYVEKSSHDHNILLLQKKIVGMFGGAGATELCRPLFVSKPICSGALIKLILFVTHKAILLQPQHKVQTNMSYTDWQIQVA